MTEPRISTLDNGITLVTQDMPGLHSAALGLWINGGARVERDHEHGIAHLLEHMAFKGTERRTAQQIAEEIEAVGGDLNAVTSHEMTAYYARILKDDMGLATDILADIIQNAVFDDAELEREQNVVVQEIMTVYDTPDDLVFDLAQTAAFPSQSLGRPILGTVDSVRSFGPADLTGYLDRTYAPDSMIVAAAGAVDHTALAADLSTRFGGNGRHAPETPAPAAFSGGTRQVERPLEQVHLVMGFQGLAAHDPDVYAAQVLATILGGGMSSRLFQEVREKRGLCYGIYAYHWSVSDAGLFGIYAATTPHEVEELGAVVVGEIGGMIETLDDVELARAKAQLKAGLVMSLESPAARIEQMARQMVFFGRTLTPDEIVARVDSVSRDDIARLAGRLVSAAEPAIAAVGPGRGLASVDRFAAKFF